MKRFLHSQEQMSPIDLIRLIPAAVWPSHLKSWNALISIRRIWQIELATCAGRFAQRLTSRARESVRVRDTQGVICLLNAISLSLLCR